MSQYLFIFKPHTVDCYKDFRKLMWMDIESQYQLFIKMSIHQPKISINYCLKKMSIVKFRNAAFLNIEKEKHPKSWALGLNFNPDVPAIRHVHHEFKLEKKSERQKKVPFFNPVQRHFPCKVTSPLPMNIFYFFFRF